MLSKRKRNISCEFEQPKQTTVEKEERTQYPATTQHVCTSGSTHPVTHPVQHVDPQTHSQNKKLFSNICDHKWRRTGVDQTMTVGNG